MRRWLMVCLVCALGSAVPTRAHAQSKGDVELAKRYYAVGEELYRRSDYDGALKEFQRAFKAVPKPDLLYNIARCYEGLGKRKEAIDHYRRYLAKASPSSRDRAIVKARIANLERMAKRAQKAETQKAQRAQEARAAAAEAERKRREELARRAKDAREAKEQTKGDGRSSALAIAGWSAAGAGVTMVVVGAVLGGMAKSKASSIEEANANGTQYSEVAGDFDTGESLEKASIGLLVGGGVAAVAGGVLLFLHYRGSSERATARASAPRLVVTPAVTPQSASLAVTCRF
jgi:tetratricopeptide (TPR) repeat protein